jgi:phage portal protein BeeE
LPAKNLISFVNLAAAPKALIRLIAIMSTVTLATTAATMPSVVIQSYHSIIYRSQEREDLYRIQ